MFKLSCPGKIFLAGEYLALKGGPSFTLCVEPRFALEVRKKNASGEAPLFKVDSGISPESPAGKWILHHHEFFRDLDLRFVDPYQGRGGFGASSAQFLLVYFLKTDFVSLSNGLLIELSVDRLLAAYRHYSGNMTDPTNTTTNNTTNTTNTNNTTNNRQGGWLPSGADLLAQMRGGFVYGASARGALDRLTWPFDHLEFVAWATGNKIATHEHLKNLGDFSEAPLERVINSLEKGIRAGDQALFLEAFCAWGKELEALNLVHAKTLEMLQTLKSDPRVLGAKGCGALGADVILVLLATKDRDNFVRDHKISKPFTVKNLSQGIQWEPL